MMASAFSGTTLVWVVVSVLAQVAGVAMLPRTQGLTQPLMTVVCASFFAVGIGALARLSHRGVELGIVIPIMSATIPLATIAIGILLYGESASPLKIALLLTACIAIGWAATLSGH